MWFKLDDHGWCHAKVAAAGNEAYGAWCRAGQWSSSQLTDGFIPEAIALVIAPVKVWRKLELCGGPGRAGLVDRVEGGWQIHDYLDFNPAASNVRASRAELAEKRGEAGKRGMVKRWGNDGNLPSKPITKPYQPDNNAITNAYQKDNPVPVPVPVPEGIPPLSPPSDDGGQQPTEPAAAKQQRKKPGTTMPDDWAPTEANAQLAKELGRDLQSEASRFRDYCHAHGKQYAEWGAAFGNWLRNDRYRGQASNAQNNSNRPLTAYPVQSSGRGFQAVLDTLPTKAAQTQEPADELDF